jgi:hypothetical protein
MYRTAQSHVSLDDMLCGRCELSSLLLCRAAASRSKSSVLREVCMIADYATASCKQHATALLRPLLRYICNCKVGRSAPLNIQLRTTSIASTLFKEQQANLRQQHTIAAAPLQCLKGDKCVCNCACALTRCAQVKS